MFARRKRQPQDEEPLVPHGLVGQATENPEPPEKPKIESRHGPVQIPEPHPPQAKNLPEDQHAKKPAASLSLPLPTPAKTTAQPMADVDTVPVTTVTIEKAASGGRQQRGEEHRSLRTWAVARIQGGIGQARGLLSKTRGRVSARSQRGRILLAHAGKSALITLRRHHLSLEWRRGFDHGHKLLSELAHGAATQCRKTWGDSALRFRSLTSGSSPRPKQHAGFSLTPEEADPTRHKVRVRLTGLPLRGKILLTRAVSEWRLKRELLLYNSRLWTSMAMGFLAAILALGLVYATRHYAQAGLPSNRIPTVSSGTSFSAPAPVSVAVRPPKLRAVAVKESTPVPAVQRKPPQAAKVANPQSAHPRVRRLKPHRNEDDDYVARDTYVYYGVSPAKSR